MFDVCSVARKKASIKSCMSVCAPGAATLCGGGPRRGRGGTQFRSVSLFTVKQSHLWGSRNPEFFDHRLQTSVTRATLEDSTTGPGQTFRTGRPLLGGLSFHGFQGLCTSSLPGGTQAQGLRTRSMQAWASSTGGRQLHLINTPLVAISAVNSVGPTPGTPHTTTKSCMSVCGTQNRRLVMKRDISNHWQQEVTSQEPMVWER